MQHFPAAGEIVIFDRSWYNRAGVEYVMGFCSEEEHQRFLRVCPSVEKYIVDTGVQIIKFWLEVGDEEQKSRFEARIEDFVALFFADGKRWRWLGWLAAPLHPPRYREKARRGTL